MDTRPGINGLCPLSIDFDHNSFEKMNNRPAILHILSNRSSINGWLTVFDYNRPVMHTHLNHMPIIHFWPAATLVGTRG